MDELYVMVFALEDEKSTYIVHFVESQDEIRRFGKYMQDEFMEEQYLLLGPITEGKQPFLERVFQQFPNTVEV